MTFAHGEPIGLWRDGNLVATVFGGIDPYEHRLVLPPNVDVAGGDIATFRGLTRRVNAEPLVWRSPFTGWDAGIMAPLEDAPAVLPDLARLLRASTDEPTIDEATGQLSYPASTEVWTGYCHVEPGIGQGTNVTDLASERISNLTSVATVPITCVNVQPDDILRVLSSRDQYLTTRDLVVIGVRITSDGYTRDLLVRDNQG